MSRQFGAVFKDAQSGGPVYTGLKNESGYPSWIDWRSPGNTNANESAEEIFKKWDKDQMKRFEIFMEQFYKSKTPWKQDWLERTAPNFKSHETKIIKCKLELIKRLLKIKMVGPESMEDWVLLFLYTENQLNIPGNIENLIRPRTSEVDEAYYLRTPQLPPNPREFWVTPAEQWIDNPTNMKLWGFEKGVYDLTNNYESPGLGTRRGAIQDSVNNLRRVAQRAQFFPLLTEIPRGRAQGSEQVTTQMRNI